MNSKVKEIFLEAIELADNERQEFLIRKCNGDQETLDRIKKLILAHELSDSPVDFSPVMLAGKSESIGTEQPGTRLGPYVLKEQIGAGGMGVVWVAERTEPIRQRVAIKVIKPGMDSEQVIARFEAERHALALMEHPNIAKVLDAGTTSFGRPYFVMELIRGLSITEYCDSYKLGLEDRLKIFVDVCKAIHHAHQKGIIHRDIKPTNLLVTDQDGEPHVRVIDFGVAKAVEGSLSDKSVYSGFFHAIGTLEYMSPEQAGLANADIDTRSDVYSLGIVLHELLISETPFSNQDLSSSLEAACRVIREVMPDKPSRQFLRMERPIQEQVAMRLGTSPQKLTKCLKGDLDLVVQKALAKDRNVRYQSAARLSEDIRRFVDGHPVKASPPSMLYRARKAWASYRIAIQLTALSIGILAACLAYTLQQSYRLKIANRETTKAEKAANDAKLSLAQDLYFSQMREAERNFNHGNLTKAEEVVDRYAGSETVKKGFELQYLRSRIDRTRGDQLWENERPLYTLSLSENGRVAVSSQNEVQVFDNIDSRNEIANFKTKPNDSLHLTTGEKNFWSFPFAAISQCGSFVAYAHPERIDTVVISSIDEDKSWQLGGHAQTVRCASFLNDSTLVTGDHEGNVRSWNFKSNKVKVKSVHKGSVWSVATSDDGKLVASGSVNNRICVWDIESDNLAYLEGHFDIPSTTKGVTSVAFAPKSKYLASAGADHTVRIWDLETRRSIQVLSGHVDEVRSVAFSKDGSFLASGSRDNSVRLWDWKRGFELSKYFGPSYVAQSVQFTSDCRFVVATSFDGTIHRWPVSRKNSEVFWLDKPVADLSVSPNGLAIVAVETNSTKIHIWNIGREVWQESHRTIEAAGEVNAVSINDEKLLAAMLDNGEMQVFDVANSVPNEIVRISIFAPSELKQLNFHHEAFNYSDDGSQLAIGSPIGSIAIFDFATKTIERKTITSQPVRSLVIQQPFEVLATDTDNRLYKVDLKKGASELVQSDVRFVTHRNRMLATSGVGKVALSDLETGDESVQNTRFREVRFLDESTLVLSTGYSTELEAGELYLWDTKLDRLRYVFQAHHSIVECFDTCHNAQVIASGSLDGSIMLFNIEE